METIPLPSFDEAMASTAIPPRFPPMITVHPPDLESKKVARVGADIKLDAAKYACTNGPSKAVAYVKAKYDIVLDRSTISKYRRKYLDLCKNSTRPVTSKSFEDKKAGAPSLLGTMEGFLLTLLRQARLAGEYYPPPPLPAIFGAVFDVFGCVWLYV